MLRLILYVLGVLVVIVGAVRAAVLFAERRFTRMVDREVDAMLAPPKMDTAFSAGMVADLPPPVQRYLLRAVPEGTPLVQNARLHHGGTFRPAPDQPWMPVEGEQVFTVDPPGFHWSARVMMVPGLWVRARDRFNAGRGNMLIKLESLFPIADASGPAIDQGSLMRYMAETMWFPTAMLHMDWQPIDDHTARATLRTHGTEASLDYHFNEEDDLVMVRGDRYRDAEKMAPWVGECHRYAEMAGVCVPVEIEVKWLLEAGEYSYARFAIDKIDYNVT